VVAQETEQGGRWAEAKIKQMTGGDKIAARFMWQDFFTYMPQFKLIIAGAQGSGSSCNRARLPERPGIISTLPSR
jgi:hypothetical protein